MTYSVFGGMLNLAEPFMQQLCGMCSCLYIYHSQCTSVMNGQTDRQTDRLRHKEHQEG